MKFAMSSSPHIRTSDTTGRIMGDVLIALIPALVAGTIFFGPRCLVVAAVSTAAAVVVLPIPISPVASRRIPASFCSFTS